ncbi:hypothetical protein NQZ68_007649 [Dissostichus eleginoides]|nr:hypothetical protein NQZ68_007649 [Dissostichus eleginoides]
MKRGSDISDFLFPFCSRPPLKNPSDFQPDSIFEKKPSTPVLSVRMTAAMGHGLASLQQGRQKMDLLIIVPVHANERDTGNQ